jgi:hypothetical protein
VFASALFERLAGQGGRDSDEAAAAAAASQVLAGAPRPSDDFGSTGFAARDASGELVACTVTMGSPFGSGHTANATGIVLAQAPASKSGTAAAFLSPVIAGSGMLAGAGAGGPGATEAIATAALRFSRGVTVGGSISLRTSDALHSDTINAIVCQQGACSALPDPSGSGLGLAAEAPSP